MNRKNTLIVIFVVIGALVVSAFSLVANNNNNKASLQRGREADAARYTAMAEYDAAKDGTALQRGREADAARYTAMARYYEAQNSQPGDLSKYFMSERSSYAAPATANLSWPSRPDFSVLIEKAVIPVTASAAGLAIYHQSEWAAPVAAQNGLAQYYLSERGTLAAAQNGLDIYYQSERNAAQGSAIQYGPPGR